MVTVTPNIEKEIFTVKYDEVKRIDEVSFEKVSNWIDGALEGGSNYWYFIIDQKKPKKDTCFVGDYPLSEDGSFTILDTQEAKNVPELKGYMKIHRSDYGADTEWLEKHGTKYTVDINRIAEGLKKFIIADNERYNQMLNDENGECDSLDDDVFFQFVVLGECIYG